MCVYVSSHMTTGSARCRQEMTHLDAADFFGGEGRNEMAPVFQFSYTPGGGSRILQRGGGR